MRAHMRRSALGLSALFFFGCGASTPADAGTDASTHADAGPPCTTDTSCDDHQYCDGVERCLPAAPGADGRGCVALTTPCGTRVCDEAMHRCVTSCATSPDA